MNFLEKLLDDREFQWRTLGDLGSFIRGSGIQKSDFTESGAGCIHYGQIHTHYGTWATKTKSCIGHEFAARLRKAYSGDLVIATTSEDDDAVAKAVAWLGNEEVAVSTDAYIYRHTINPKYMSYFFQTEIFQSQKKPYITGTKVRRISGDSLAKIQIPIPCPENPKKSLEIQTEIVRILDTFTELTVVLTVELTARRKQYNHYRDQLLSFKDGVVEWKTLGYLAENLDSMRKPITSGLRDPGDIPYYGASGIVDYVKDYIFAGDYLLVSEDGANLLARNTPIAFSISGKSWVNNHVHVLKFKTYAERKYVEFYLNSIDLTPYISGAAQPKLNKRNLESISIPNLLPKDKERIVAILDKFDALTNSITEGLPREIALRQRQYEYYRDLLLSFPKPASEMSIESAEK
ncbi:restriction endonuclease subunit S [Rhodoferax antarcticus]|uniref:Type I restriction modification DNA specificity domain protein n=1 Tax=Rhodoferax antarcticus ANT.BR TaxID=1111071 RepID=A0A1Q8YEU5_9BURK|nr:restriction endonuclease subunit S [Rhodoferax antarcticus]OLP06594.1 type I restriction modification DNA specificity domain protein [Rhodoferax antarcticus ANT.BR]